MTAKGKNSQKRRVGRPSLPYDEGQAKQVLAMSQYGVPQENMADILGMSVESLVKLYGKEFKQGRAFANMTIGKTLFEKAKGGDTAAAIFWAKTQMGWRETTKLDVDMKKPPTVEIILNAPGITPETK